MMTGILHFETFLAAGILLNITPGNDTIFIISRSLAQGRKAGILSVLGIATGSLIHTTMAAFGLSLVIAKSLTVFNLVKYAGAVYLVFIGYKMIRDRTKFHAAPGPGSNKLKTWKVYSDAVITNVLNPKVALFFIAFLPQFIDSSHGDSTLPFMILGTCFTITGTIWCLLLAGFASCISKTLSGNPKIAAYFNKACGAVMILLGIKVALTGRK
jgi:threonine/homoserine/homoserine lactone efflux protein